jgi:hypothetical protein
MMGLALTQMPAAELLLSQHVILKEPHYVRDLRQQSYAFLCLLYPAAVNK